MARNKLYWQFQGNLEQKPVIKKRLKIDNTTISEPAEVVNALNSYFCNLGSSLADKLPPAPFPDAYQTYLSKPLQNSFYVDSISKVEIENAIDKLKGRKSVGIDNISAKLVYEFKVIFSPLLGSIFNLSLESGIFFPVK